MSAAQATPDVRYAVTEPDVAACYGLMRQLRPGLQSEAEFITRWKRQAAAGYRLLALWQGSNPIALAGFRSQENLVHGRHIYLDDLVTDEAARSRGYGRILMEHLRRECRTLGCAKLLLDTPLSNVFGHRFYYRHGLLAIALRFSLVLPPNGEREQ